MQVLKFWGTEEFIANDLYCGKILRIDQGAQSSLHFHKQKDETFYVLEGQIALEVERNPFTNPTSLVRHLLGPGNVVHVPPLTLHRFAGLDETNVFLEVSTPDSEQDTVRLEPSRRAKEAEGE